MTQEGNLERRVYDKALKIHVVIRGFVGSLFEILNEEDLYTAAIGTLGVHIKYI